MFDRRLTLFDAADAAWPRIARMGIDAIAASHAAGHPAWVEDRDGRTWRLDPDGSRHVETRSAGEVLEAARVARRAALGARELGLHAARDPARDRTRDLVLDTDEEIEAAAVRTCHSP